MDAFLAADRYRLSNGRKPKDCLRDVDRRRSRPRRFLALRRRFLKLTTLRGDGAIVLAEMAASLQFEIETLRVRQTQGERISPLEDQDVISIDSLLDPTSHHPLDDEARCRLRNAEDE
jgi:hypothetical protein